MLITTLNELQEYNLSEQNTLLNDPDYYKWYRSISSIYKQVVDATRFEYREYQVKYAAMSCLRRCNLLGHSQGAGKTITSALVIAALYPDINCRAGRVHVLVPGALAASRWLADLQLIEQLKNKVSWISSITDLNNAIANKSPIFLYNYDFLKKSYNSKQVAKVFAKHYRPSLLILDELHNLSNTNSQRYKTVSILRRRSKRVLGLTGTLSDGRLEQVSTLCSLVYRSAWNYTNKGLARQFGRKKKLETNYLTGSTGDLNRYLNQLDPSKVADYYNLSCSYMHRLTLDDPEVKSSITLPQVEVITIKSSMSLQQRRAYEEIVDLYKNQMRAIISSAPNPTLRFQALKLINPLINIANSPTDEISNKVKDLSKQALGYKKVAIFCHRVASARYLEDYLVSLLGRSVVRLYAQDELKNPKVMREAERLEVVRKFQEDSKVRIGIFSISLAAESIDLTSAEAVFFYCLPWQSVKVMQAASRVVRPGNVSSQVNVVYFANEKAIDEHQLNLYLQKSKQTQMLLDYDGIEVSLDENDNEGDINPYDVLTQIVDLL